MESERVFWGFSMFLAGNCVMQRRIKKSSMALFEMKIRKNNNGG